MLKEREDKKARQAAEEAERKARGQAALQKLKDQANAKAAAEQKAKEEKEAARVAALTPEERAAEEVPAGPIVGPHRASMWDPTSAQAEELLAASSVRFT